MPNTTMYEYGHLDGKQLDVQIQLLLKPRSGYLGVTNVE